MKQTHTEPYLCRSSKSAKEGILNRTKDSGYGSFYIL